MYLPKLRQLGGLKNRVSRSGEWIRIMTGYGTGSGAPALPPHDRFGVSAFHPREARNRDTRPLTFSANIGPSQPVEAGPTALVGSYAVLRWERYQSVIWLLFMNMVSLRACNPSTMSVRKLIW